MSLLQQAQRRILTMAEVAAMTGTPIDTLRYWRFRGTGPASYRIGRRVVYDLDVVERWLDQQRQGGSGSPAA